MKYFAEGAREAAAPLTLETLRRALMSGEILESRALSFDGEKRLHFRFEDADGMMLYEECADGVREGTVRDIALITRVGRPVCFTVVGIDEDAERPLAYLSRTQAQIRCKREYLDGLVPGDILPCRVTHLERFGAFCDVGCGIPALLPIDCMSVSRIQSPADRVQEGQEILCVVKNRDALGRIVLTMKELLGTWKENAAAFAPGETVVGVVRSTEPYGVFVELRPNLAGLAETCGGLCPGQLVSVYIKSILPEKMKIKLVVLHAALGERFAFPLEFHPREGHLNEWRYSVPGAARVIETVFEAPKSCEPSEASEPLKASKLPEASEASNTSELSKASEPVNP